MDGFITLNQAQPEVQRKFMTGVYLRMFIALIITTVSAYVTVSSQVLLNAIYGSWLIYGLIIGELVLVVTISAAIRKLSPLVAMLLFVLYSVVNGMTLSSVFLLYSVRSITRVFLATAVMFLAMSVYAIFSKSDLSKYSRYLGMGLIGILAVSVLNLIFKSSLIEWGVSILGVGIFAGLTAYDTQKFMKISIHDDGSENFQKLAIFAALELYLDFINIFIRLLRLFGKRK
ncbi:MAG: Bax inhibitor-1/YccA family protein [Treponemataceae bacterium]|nr:Bax inhibitor-1/YccA family protein [Treponemataceae bacterium]